MFLWLVSCMGTGGAIDGGARRRWHLLVNYGINLGI